MIPPRNLILVLSLFFIPTLNASNYYLLSSDYGLSIDREAVEKKIESYFTNQIANIQRIDNSVSIDGVDKITNTQLFSDDFFVIRWYIGAYLERNILEATTKRLNIPVNKGIIHTTYSENPMWIPVVRYFVSFTDPEARNFYYNELRKKGIENKEISSLDKYISNSTILDDIKKLQLEMFTSIKTHIENRELDDNLKLEILRTLFETNRAIDEMERIWSVKFLKKMKKNTRLTALSIYRDLNWSFSMTLESGTSRIKKLESIKISIQD